MLDEEEARLQLRILSSIRAGEAVTRPDLSRLLKLGRAIVSQRIELLMEAGLVIEGEIVAVPRGRSPRTLSFNPERAQVLCVDVGARGINVGLAQLDGSIVEQAHVEHEVALGPDATMTVIQAAAGQLLEKRANTGVDLWGVGAGLPAPVEFRTGRPIAPPIMPGWDGYPIREELSARFNAPVWVDNDVNLMALGEVRAGAARGVEDVVVMKVGTGIGAALVSGGRMHRGAQGAAGDVGHVRVTEDPSIVCRCGQIGCLEAVAGGYALTIRGRAAAQSGESTYLMAASKAHELSMADIVEGSHQGDPFCVALLAESARLVGESASRGVNYFNPATLLIGGRVAEAGDPYLASIRNIVYARSTPLATRDLVIARVGLGDRATLCGAAHLVIDEIFSPRYFAGWIELGRPTVIAAAQKAG